MKSKLFNLKLNDWSKGLLVAVVAAVVAAFSTVFDADGFNMTQEDFLFVLKAGVISGIAYLVKNFASNDKGKVLKRNGKI